MEERVNPQTHCNHCRSLLSYDENRNCKVCRTCHPVQKEKPPAEEKERRYLDIKMTNEMVQEIAEEVIDKIVPDMIRGVLENWHIQRPPVTKTEITEDLIQHDHEGNVSSSVVTLKPKTWRQQAKGLGIEVYDKVNKRPRLKIDVLEDIENKLTVPA